MRAGTERITIEGWRVRNDPAIAAAARAAGHWPDETLAERLSLLAASAPERVLLQDGDVRLSAASLEAASARLASWLAERFTPGEVISMMLPNWHEAAIIYLAATRAGMVVNPLLPNLRERDLGFVLGDCRSRVVFAPEEFRGFSYRHMLQNVARDLPQSPLVMSVRGHGEDDLAALLAHRDSSAALARVDPDAVRMVMYTSGTTGRPKGVLHTHNSLAALIGQIGAHWLVETGDRFLVPSPISHIGGSIYAFEAPLLLGTTAILMDRWDPRAALDLMRAERITHMAGATPFLDGLLAAAREAGEHLPDLKVFICGGASVPPRLIEAASGWFDKARVSRVYGSTEVPVTTVGALAQPAMAQAAHTDGKPALAEVLIAADGEVRARGAQMFAGYLHEEDDAAAFDAEGFYRTGDLGRLDAEGYLTITGRIKDLIIRNGENIAPKEIEDLLAGHPDITDIAIVGIPDGRTGERACAVIVAAAGAQPDVASLGAYLEAQGIARFKFPEQVELRNTLPRNAAGKVLKHVLRSEIAASPG